MGERGAANEPATDDDIVRMAELVAEGVAAGAVGVSVNRLELHKAVDGREVPGTFAAHEEICALVRGGAHGIGRRGVHHHPARGSRRADRAVWDARSTGSARSSRETGLAVTFPFGGSRGGTWRQTARPHRARERRRRAHRPAGQLARPGPVLRAAHVASVPRPAHATRRSRTCPSPSAPPRMAEPDVRAAIVAERPPTGRRRASATSCSPNRDRGVPVAPRARLRARSRRPASRRRPSRSGATPRSCSTTGPSPTTATRSSTSSSVAIRATST